MSDRLDLCGRDDLAPGEARRFDVGGHRIALVRVGDDFHAVDDRCTHADISLAEGEVDEGECTIECWKHGSTFSLVTGEPESLPATKPTRVHPVELDGDRVVVVIADE